MAHCAVTGAVLTYPDSFSSSGGPPDDGVPREAFHEKVKYDAASMKTGKRSFEYEVNVGYNINDTHEIPEEHKRREELVQLGQVGFLMMEQVTQLKKVKTVYICRQPWRDI